MAMIKLSKATLTPERLDTVEKAETRHSRVRQARTASMEKVATQPVTKLEDDYAYHHVIGLHGDQKDDNGDYVGNDNGDFFWWRQTLLARREDDMYAYQTWIGGDVLENHDERQIRGFIADVWPVFKDKSIDMLKATNKKVHSLLVTNIDNAKITDVSMGTIVGHSYCGVPGCTRHASKEDPNITEEDWCFVPGTNVHLHDGSVRPVEEVQQGDILLTHAGNQKPVNEVLSKQHHGQLLSVQVSGNCTPIRCTPNHPFVVVRHEEMKCIHHKAQKCKFGEIKYCDKYEKRNGGCDGSQVIEEMNPQFVPAESLREGDYVVMYLPDEKKSELTMNQVRLIGLFAAEGSYIKRDGCRVGGDFALSSEEKDLADQIMAMLKIEGCDVWAVDKSEQGELCVRFASTEVAALLFKHTGEYASSKILSDEIVHLEQEKAVAFLNALFDGDGCRKKTGPHTGRLEYNTVSQSLAYQTMLMLYRVGVCPNIIARDRREEKHDVNGRSVSYKNICYQISVTKRDANKMICETSSKIDVAEHLMSGSRQVIIGDKMVLRPIYRIEESEYDGMVHNFEVADDNSYVVEFSGVHNCHHLRYYKGGKDPVSGHHVYEDNRDIFGVECSWITIGAGADSGAKMQMKVASITEQQLNGNMKVMGASVVSLFAKRKRRS